MGNAINLIDVVALSKLKCRQPIIGDLKYATQENFIGRLIDGYTSGVTDVCLLAPEAASMLCQVQNALQQQYNYGLIIFDAYRPLRAVKDFMAWFSQPPVNDFELQRKAIHYPLLEKHTLSDHGYIAKTVSKHCYGQAVDLGLMDLSTGQQLDMGTCFDYFSPLSHPVADSNLIGEQAYHYRNLLIMLMQQYHFQVYAKEYWHFDYVKRENLEPLDVVITADLAGLGTAASTAGQIIT